MVEAAGAPGADVLVVEDEPRLLSVLEQGLAGHGHRVRGYGSAEDALADGAGEVVHAAVLDVQLPGMDGVELGRRIKAAAGPDSFLPVILIGGHDAVDERVRGLRGGCDDFLGKPVHLFELAARLESLLARRRAHAELVRVNRELRAAQERKRQLAALVVHDLRNPLSAMLGNVELLAEMLGPDRPAPVGQVLRDIEELGGKALSFLASLLDVEELEEGLLRARLAEVDVAAFAARFPRSYRVETAARQVTLELDVPAGLTAQFDEALIYRVVENLLDNAVRYAQRGGRVVLRAERDGALLRFLVGNDGPPIADSERPRLFTRYYRLEARREGARANRGLGLYFCRLAAEAHGGSIDVVSTAEFPACFVVELPQR